MFSSVTSVGQKTRRIDVYQVGGKSTESNLHVESICTQMKEPALLMNSVHDPPALSLRRGRLCFCMRRIRMAQAAKK